MQVTMRHSPVTTGHHVLRYPLQSWELHFACNARCVPTAASFHSQQVWNVPSPARSPGAPSVPFLCLVPVGPDTTGTWPCGPCVPSAALLRSCPQAGVWCGEGGRQAPSCSSRTEVQSLERNAPNGSRPLGSLPVALSAFHPTQGLCEKGLFPTG